MIKKLKAQFRISQERKLKIFKFTNKLIFCRILRFHLPFLGPKGVTCVICDKVL